MYLTKTKLPLDNLIHPAQVTNFSRTQEELELFAMFAICVAGKNSEIQAKKLDEFLKGNSPLAFVRALINEDALISHMKHVKLGQYTRISKTFGNLFTVNLRWSNIDALESAMGLKTSRFFLVHSRPNVRVAVLDTHILQWMKDEGYDVPRQTPTNKKKYREIEDKFLAECDKRGVSPAQLDLEIWKSRNKKIKV